jgi:hypothetical protein
VEARRYSVAATTVLVLPTHVQDRSDSRSSAYDLGVGVGFTGASGRGSTGLVNERATAVLISAAILGFSVAAWSAVSLFAATAWSS